MTFRAPLIGILGGMGPQAGLDLADKLIAGTNASVDQDHLPFVLFSLPDRVPDRTSFLFSRTDLNPASAIADQFEKMDEIGVTIAVMACNTAHAGPIFDRVLELLKERGVRMRILHLIRETVAFIGRTYPDIRRVGILGTQGTYRSHLYDDALQDAGFEAVLPDENVRRNNIHTALYDPEFGIKSFSNPVSSQASSLIHSAVDHVRDRGAEAVILGCTELPLAVRDNYAGDVPILDPARIMAALLIRETYPERAGKNP
jgi:aspartate racemase